MEWGSKAVKQGMRNNQQENVISKKKKSSTSQDFWEMYIVPPRAVQLWNWKLGAHVSADLLVKSP